MKISDPVEVMKALQEPFEPSDIEWRVSRSMKTSKGDKAIVLAYVTNRAIQKRLDDLFTPFGWKNEFKEWRDKGTLCGISIFWNGDWITKWDGADETNFEATKGGFSGSMKRAAVEWGIGRFLYNLDETWVDVKDRGEHYINDKKSNVTGYWDTPKLPVWALPKGYKQETKTETNKPEEPHPIGTIKQETVGEIKTQWLKMKYKPEALNVQLKKLFGCEITGMKEEDAQDFLAMLHETHRQHESEKELKGA